MDIPIPPASKKEAVAFLLDEMKKLIHKAIDAGKDGELSPLDLIATLTQQLIFEAIKMDDEFEKDISEKPKGDTTH